MKTYRIKVIAGKRKEGVQMLSDGRLQVAVKAKREKGAANDRMCELLAAHFGVSSAGISIQTGHTSAGKTVRIKDL